MQRRGVLPTLQGHLRAVPTAEWGGAWGQTYDFNHPPERVPLYNTCKQKLLDKQQVFSYTIVEKDIPGFGELFRMLSFEKIGTSTVQSRALAGVAGGTYLFALPGSTSACKDGWDEILRYQLDIRPRPCNLVEIMPRLNESATTRRNG